MPFLGLRALGSSIGKHKAASGAEDKYLDLRYHASGPPHPDFTRWYTIEIRSAQTSLVDGTLPVDANEQK